MTLGCERFKSVQGTKTVKSNACTIEPSFNIMVLKFLVSLTSDHFSA